MLLKARIVESRQLTIYNNKGKVSSAQSELMAVHATMENFMPKQ
jgi:hypothetical protein